MSSRPVLRPFILSLLLMVLCMSKSQSADIWLESWPAEAAEKLTTLIEKHAHQGHFAVFDMDNTSYQHDLTESLMAYLEERGILTRERLDPSLKLIPFRDENGVQESLFGYYNRLCVVVDVRVCSAFLSQVFSGLTLGEIKTHVDAMLADARPIKVRYFDGDNISEGKVTPPRLFAGQQQLFKALKDNGIEVYIITAGSEEIIRMVAADPQYGYHVKPEHVIGVTLLLKNRQTGQFTTSDVMIAEGRYDMKANLELELTSHLVSPATWMEGKAAVILSRIDRWRKPILAAGDSPASDGYMLLNGLADDGVKLWVNRSASNMDKIRTMITTAKTSQERLGLPVTADKNWIIVTPDDIR